MNARDKRTPTPEGLPLEAVNQTIEAMAPTTEPEARALTVQTIERPSMVPQQVAQHAPTPICLLYTSDAADDAPRV